MLNENYHLKTFQEDWDWENAFHEAIYGNYGRFDLSCVNRVITCDAGENDCKDWIAVVEFKDGQSPGNEKFAVMSAGCDYTGWDCQAGGVIDYFCSEGEALTNLTPDQIERLCIKL